MKKGVSEIIGQAVCGDGSKAAAYRALRSLVCSSCGGQIAEGEMFTRAPQTGAGLRLWPRCQACVPFALEPGRQARSSLLKSLLTPTEHEQPPTTQPDRTESAASDERRNAAEAMRQRLGPALERARRSRNR